MNNYKVNDILFYYDRPYKVRVKILTVIPYKDIVRFNVIVIADPVKFDKDFKYSSNCTMAIGHTFTPNNTTCFKSDTEYYTHHKKVVSFWTGRATRELQLIRSGKLKPKSIF